MRKFFVMLFVAVAAMATNTKANETMNTDVKNQYVRWDVVPTNPSKAQLVAWLKSAATAKAIPGAQVRSTAEAYASVWGVDLYQEVIAAGDDQFVLGKSSGDELNFALDGSGKPVLSGILSKGVDIIGFKRKSGQLVELAKWGSNGCLNALSHQQQNVVDGTDPDNQGGGVFDHLFTRQQHGNTLINVNGLGQSNQKQEISWSDGYGIFKTGMDQRQNDFIVDAALFTMIQNNKQCCGNTNTGVVTTGYSLSGSVVSAVPQQQVLYTAAQPAKQKVPFGQTFGGQLLANFGGVFLANELSESVNLFGGRNVCGRCGSNCGGTCGVRSGPGFGWNNGGTLGGGFTPYTGASPAGSFLNPHSLSAGMWSTGFSYVPSNYNAVVSPGLSQPGGGPGFGF